MALPKISEARDLSDEEVAEQIIAIKKQLFQLLLEKVSRQLDMRHQFKHAKHPLAQLLMVEHDRKRAVAKTSEAIAADGFPGGLSESETPLQE